MAKTGSILLAIDTCARIGLILADRELVLGRSGCHKETVESLSNASHACGLSNGLNRFTFIVSKALNSFFFRVLV